MRNASRIQIALYWALFACAVAALAATLASCGHAAKADDSQDAAANIATAGVVKVAPKPLERQLTVSSELVPFQEIDVYAKESGYVRKLSVDYGTRVQAGQVMAVLEIPELQMQLQQDDAMVNNARDQVMHASHELGRVEAQHKVLQLQFDRLDGVSKANPGLVAQQEVDDSQGRDLAAEAQVEASKSSLEATRSQLLETQAKRRHDQVLYDYAKITAPFAGIITQRYANLGALMQAGTSSSTQAMPLVRLSQDNLFRLVIPVPESYVRYIRVGDTANVMVPSLNRSFPGKVARFSMDVKEDTRTMHTEVDVPNPNRVLMPGLYAEATLTLEKKDRALAVPLQAVNHEGGQTTVYAVNSEGRIEDRKVALGIETDSDAEVISGLRDGEMVVVSDRSGLKPGQRVQPQVVEPLQYRERKDE
ncbi:MAG: efflux RND transporter periplasmic adaptor subunit [Bryobacteraceae bacterium]